MKRNRKIIYLAGFLCSIPVALTSYINSSFLGNFLNAYNVSLVYAIASIIAIISMLHMPAILNRIGNRSSILFFGFLFFSALLGLAFGSSAPFLILCFIVYFVANIFIFTSLDIFIEDFSQGSTIGGIRGLYLMSINCAWVLSQIISGTIIAKSSFKGIYIFAALFTVLFCTLFIVFLRDFKDPKYNKVPILKTVKVFFKNKRISRVYLINFILKFFFAWMIIYTPIYLHNYMHFEWEKLGIIFSIMLLPFVILDFTLGKISDHIGEKKILSLGFFICAAATLTIPFITSSSLLVWGAILFATRVGAASVEVMSESYFFKLITERDDNEISFFRNTSPLSFIIAPISGALTLAFVPEFRYLFFVLSVVLLLGLYTSLKLRDVK